MTKFCGHCGAAREDNAAFCTECGAPIRTTKPTKQPEENANYDLRHIPPNETGSTNTDPLTKSVSLSKKPKQGDARHSVLIFILVIFVIGIVAIVSVFVGVDSKNEEIAGTYQAFLSGGDVFKTVESIYFDGVGDCVFTYSDGTTSKQDFAYAYNGKTLRIYSKSLGDKYIILIRDYPIVGSGSVQQGISGQEILIDADAFDRDGWKSFTKVSD